MPALEKQWDLRTISYRPGDINKGWQNLEDVEVVLLQYWMAARLPIQEIEEKNRVVLFTGGSWRRLSWCGYYVENVREGLDSPGTWYLDRKQGSLYYYPLPNEDMVKAEVIAPVAEQLVRFEGDAVGGRLCAGSNSATSRSNTPSGRFPSRATPCRRATSTCRRRSKRIERKNASSRTVSSHISAAGESNFGKDARNEVIANDFHDLGAGAIKIGEQVGQTDASLVTHDTHAADNRISDFALVYPGAIGIWIGQSSDNVVEHNDISGPVMFGISVGWSWSYFPLQNACNNRITQNHCHDLRGGPLTPFATIYALGTSPGTMVDNNYIHHVDAGIFLDNGCCGIRVEKNLVHDTTQGGFGTNFDCFGNIVQNNIFAYGKTYQMTLYGDQPEGTQPPKGELFTRNVILWKEGWLFQEPDWHTFSTLWDYNLYWREGGGQVQFMRYAFDQWKAKQLDVHSVIADPMFIDPARGDFGLKPGSPALKLGFQPIDVSHVGPRVEPGLPADQGGQLPRRKP